MFDGDPVHPGSFLIARNPNAAARLPYLLRIPLDGETWFMAGDTWPRAARVYCHPTRAPDLSALSIVEDVPVVSCLRRGPTVDLVLARGVNRRAQFIFARVKGRSMIFWQTAKAAASARPGLRVPYNPKKASGLMLLVDTRERYPYKFGGAGLETKRRALKVGDYAVEIGGVISAAVERKTIEDLSKVLSDGSLGFAMSHLATLRCAAIVVEGTYSQLLRAQYVRKGWFADVLARLQVRYPSVSIVFAESRKLAEAWTAHFLAAAAAELAMPTLPLLAPDEDPLQQAAAFIRKTRRRKATSDGDIVPGNR